MKLEKFLLGCSPLPWKVGRYGGIYQVSPKVVLLLVGETKSGHCGNKEQNEAYATHAANSLPELVYASSEYLRDTLTTGGARQATIDRLQSSIKAAEEVKP